VLRASATTRDSNELTATTSSSSSEDDNDWDGIVAVYNINNNDKILHVVHSHHTDSISWCFAEIQTTGTTEMHSQELDVTLARETAVKSNCFLGYLNKTSP